ncbi:MAG: tetrapyrrole methylase family protein / MazG family protein [Chloroflexota bacterium]|nr:tetrapyrrole methylase family protein / MazG family protein [Chloroflexota bacterium]
MPASALDRHSFSAGRAVVIVLDAPVDRALLLKHYPADVLDAAESDGVLVLPPRDPYADLAALGTVARIAERLRAPGGCPWDREQTHASLRPHLLEEAYETLEALDRGDLDTLRDELGDLLFQIAIHAQLASEAGAFDLADVSRSIGEKLIRRHPHVFGGTSLDGTDLLVQWEQIKRSEKRERTSILDGVPRSLPALFAAERLQERAARVKLRPPRIELPLDIDDPEFLGELLFDLVAEARERGFDAEAALREANGRFTAHVGRVEQRAKADGRELESYEPGELRALWEATNVEVQAA